MSKPKSYYAFSLVEAMIILVLISIAIMMLIPLMSPQKLSIPKWRRVTVTPPVGAAFDALTYGSNGNDRVGIGGVNPYTTGNSAKLATPSLSVLNTSNISSIFFGNNFVGNTYCGNTTDNCTTVDEDGDEEAIDDSRLYFHNNSIQIGMNTCNNTGDTNRIIIDGNTSRNVSCTNNNININDRIVQRGTSLAIGTLRSVSNFAEAGITADANQISKTDTNNIANQSNIYIRRLPTPTNRDIFRINFPSNTERYTPAIHYDTVTLALLPSNAAGTINVAGVVYMPMYKSSDSAVAGKTPITCDPVSAVDATCTKLPANDMYRDGYTYDTSTNTYGTGFLGGDWKIHPGSLCTNDCNSIFGNTPSDEGDGGEQAAPSDIRLKNILSQYTKGTKELLRVDTYTYSYKSDKENKTYAGIIAQKIKGIFDEALHKDENGYYSYERTPLLYAMTNSVKEINTKQNDIAKKQKGTSKEADRLIRMYK